MIKEIRFQDNLLLAHIVQSPGRDARLVVNPTQTPDYASTDERINKMRYATTKIKVANKSE